MTLRSVVRRDASWLAVIVVAAFALRIAWQVAIGFYDRPEVWEYDALGRGLLAGRYEFRFLGADWLTFGTPVYPTVLAVLHALAGGPDRYLLVGIVQAALSALLCVPSYFIAAMLLPGHWRLVASLIVAFSPPLVLYAAKVHELTFETLVAAWLLVAALATLHRPSMRRAVALGILAGIGALTRPTLLPFGALVVAVVALRASRRAAIVAAAILFAIALPWSVRNARVLDNVSLSAPYNCVTLWMGNNPNASGGTLALDGRHILETMPADLRSRVIGRPEVEQGRAFCTDAVAFIAADPPATAGWWARKFGYFWWFAPTAGSLYPPGWIDLYRAAYAVEAALALIGAAAIFRRGWRWGLVLVVLDLATVSLGQSLFYVEGRHRLLLEPLLAVLAAAGLAAAGQRIFTSRR